VSWPVKGGALSDADQEIVEAIKRGDTGAFEKLYKCHFQRIFNFAIRKLGDPAEAEDVTQEVFAAVFSCLDRFQGKSDLVVWIYGISRRETLARVQDAIADLPKDQRRILELRHSRRLAIRKIAEIMNRSEDAVKSSLYRARRTLAARLPEDVLELRS
jgi:RNA polymerase sigma-70 factor (ECF subfamily)